MERQRQPSTDAQQTDFSCLDTHLKLLVLRCCEPPELASFALTCKELHSLAECAWPEQLRHHYRLSVSAIQGPSSPSVSQALFRLLVQHGLLDRSRLPSQLLPGSAEGRRLPYHVRFQALYTDGGVDEDLYQRYWADLAFEANGWGAFCSKVSPNVNVLGLLQAQSPGEEAELSRRQFLALATRMAVGRLLARVPLPRREVELTPRQQRFFAKAQAALLRWPTLSLLRLFCLMYQHRRAGSGLGSLLDTALLHHLPAPPPSAPPPSGPHPSPVAAALAAADQPGHAYLASLTGQPACSALEGLGCAAAVFAEVAAGRLPRVVQHRLLPQGEVIEFAAPPPPPAPAVAAGRAPLSADSSAGPLPLHPVMWFRFFTRQEVEAPSPLAGTLPRMRRMLNACAPSPRTWPWGRAPPALLARHQALLTVAGELRCALQGAAPAPLHLDAAASRAAAAKLAGRGRAAAEPAQPRQLRSRTRDAGSSSRPAAAKASAAPSRSGPVRSGRAGAVRSGGRSGCVQPAADESGFSTALDKALAALHVLPDVAWSSTGQQRVLGAAAQPESGRRSGRGGAGGRVRGGASCEGTAPTGCCATQRGGEAAWSAASPQVVDSDGVQPLPAVPQQLVVAGAEGALEAVPVAGVLAPGLVVGGQRAAWDWLLLQAQAAQQRLSGGEAINPYAIPCEVREEQEFWEWGAAGGGRGQQEAGGRGGLEDDEDEDSLLDTSSESDSLFSSGFAPAEEGGILGFVPAEDVEELLGMMGYDEGMLQPQGQQPGAAAAPAMAHSAGAAPAASPSSSMDTSQFSSADSGSEELGDDDDDDEDSSSDALDSLDELDEETLNLEFAAQFPDIVETLAPSPAEHALVVSLAQLVELSTLTQTHLELEAECRALVEGGPNLSLARPAAPGQLPPGQQGVVLAAAQGIHLLPGDETASDSYAFQIAHSLEQLAAHPGLLQLELLTPRAANLVCLKLISPEDRMREMQDAHDAPNVDIQFVAFRGVSVQLPRDMVVV